MIVCLFVCFSVDLFANRSTHRIDLISYFIQFYFYFIFNYSIFRSIFWFFPLFYIILIVRAYSRARQVEVLPIESVSLQQAITLLFRLKYLRDVMLRPTIEDTGVSALNSMIAFTTADICSKVCYCVILYYFLLLYLMSYNVMIFNMMIYNMI